MSDVTPSFKSPSSYVNVNDGYTQARTVDSDHHSYTPPLTEEQYLVPDTTNNQSSSVTNPTYGSKTDTYELVGSPLIILPARTEIQPSRWRKICNSCHTWCTENNYKKLKVLGICALLISIPAAGVLVAAGAGAFNIEKDVSTNITNANTTLSPTSSFVAESTTTPIRQSTVKIPETIAYHIDSIIDVIEQYFENHYNGANVEVTMRSPPIYNTDYIYVDLGICFRQSNLSKDDRGNAINHINDQITTDKQYRIYDGMIFVFNVQDISTTQDCSMSI